jgi:hypothetical protein
VRAETRHQLKQDRFSKVTIEAAENAAHWSVEHQAKLIAAVIAVVVIAAIAFGGWYYVNSQDEKASAELSTAVRTFETPVRPAGVPAQPGYDSFASLQERATAARKQFQEIVDKYPAHPFTPTWRAILWAWPRHSLATTRPPSAVYRRRLALRTPIWRPWASSRWRTFIAARTRTRRRSIFTSN